MKYIQYSLIFISILYTFMACTWSASAVYEVTGNKTNVTIEYRGISKDNKQNEELTKVTVAALPWKIGITPMGNTTGKYKRKPLILKAYSESKGYIIVQIKQPGGRDLREELIDVTNFYLIDSNYTTNNYIEISSSIIE